MLLQFTVFQDKFDLPQAKRELIFNIADFARELPEELQNDLKLTSLENKKIIEFWVEAQTRTQSPLTRDNSLPLVAKK